MDDNFSIIWDGKEIPALEDELSEDELRQLEFDEQNLDGPYGTIPDWSKQYNADK